MARVSISLSTEHGSEIAAVSHREFDGTVMVAYETRMADGSVYDRGSLALHGTREDLRAFADMVYVATRTREEINAAQAA